ncbi:SCO family protein [Halovulum sp. GXIMD14793]
MTKAYAIIAAVVMAGVLGITASFAWFGFWRPNCSVASSGADIGGPFSLTRHDGVAVTDKDVIDGLTLIYFGYTYCPDVCPVDTARNVEAIELAAEQGVTVKPVMITIDPARDTAEVMADYASWLHPTMVGLTGTDEQIADAVKAYRAYRQKTGEGDDYLMAHTNFSYLMHPDKGLLTFFKGDETPQKISDSAACFAKRD